MKDHETVMSEFRLRINMKELMRKLKILPERTLGDIIEETYGPLIEDHGVADAMYVSPKMFKHLEDL